MTAESRDSRRPALGGRKAKPAADRYARGKPLGRAGALTQFGAAPGKSRADAGGKITFSLAKATRAALGGQAFVAHTLDLLTSDAWRARSINAVRLINLLEAEHCRHAGRENGYLRLSWNDMVAAGISRRLIGPTIAECENLGLVVATRGAYAGRARNHPSTYTLTYVPQKVVSASGAAQYAPPLHYWRNYRPAPKKTAGGRVGAGSKNAA